MSGIKQVFRDSARDAAAVAKIEAAVQKGELPRAVQMARVALDQGLIHPMLLNLRAYWHGQSGHPADALSDLRIALAIAPGDVFVRNALGLLLVRTGKWQEALPLLEETVRMAPGFAPAQYSLGWIYAFSGELAAASEASTLSMIPLSWSEPDRSTTVYRSPSHWRSSWHWGGARSCQQCGQSASAISSSSAACR